MKNGLRATLFLIASAANGATLQEKPTSFCYGTIGPGIRSRLSLRNTDPQATLSVTVRVQTVTGEPLADVVHRDLAPNEIYEAVFPSSAELHQIWAVLAVTGYRPARGDVSMHSDGPLEGSLIAEKTIGAEVKTRTSTLTPILVRDPHDRPRGIEPNKAVHRLGSFFTGEFAFIGNPRGSPLDISFCAVRSRKCMNYTLPPYAATSISLADFEAALAIANIQDQVIWNFSSATAFCNMRNGSADSAITFGDVP